MFVLNSGSADQLKGNFTFILSLLKNNSYFKFHKITRFIKWHFCHYHEVRAVIGRLFSDRESLETNRLQVVSVQRRNRDCTYHVMSIPFRTKHSRQIKLLPYVWLLLNSHFPLFYSYKLWHRRTFSLTFANFSINSLLPKHSLSNPCQIQFVEILIHSRGMNLWLSFRSSTFISFNQHFGKGNSPEAFLHNLLALYFFFWN